jgi:ribose/xylose/arabinose/galactoside ABC-type transport system permease subunit
VANNSYVYPSPVDNPDAWNDTWLYGLLNTLPASRRWMLVPLGVWVMILLAALVAGMLRYTRFGRRTFAIGSNELTARLCGIRVERTKLYIYIVGGAFAGLSGLLQFAYLTGGDPTTAVGLELNIIAAVVIGGASLAGGSGTILGTIIGALIMTVVNNGCNKLGLSNWIQEIVTGAIIIAAVTLDQVRRRTRS